MSTDEAVAIVCAALENFEAMDPSTQAKLLKFTETIKVKLDEYDEKELLKEAEQRQSKTDTARDRRKYRASVIPEWCRTNLKPGMVVKVKGNSALPYRTIESFQERIFTGRHCGTQLTSVDGKYKRVWGHGSYITDHLYKNVQGVMLMENDKPAKYIPIMELVEGKQEI